MNEAAAYEALRPRLQALGLDPHRIENVLAKGTPDVNYSGGWIENKYLPAWPVKAGTLVKVQTLIERPEQVVWLTRRWAAGGPAWLMLRVDRRVMLFAGPDARAVRLGRTQVELMDLACWQTNAHGEGDWLALKAWLLWRDEELTPPRRARLLRLRCGKTVAEAATLLGVGMRDVEVAEAMTMPLTNDLIDAWVA